MALGRLCCRRVEQRSGVCRALFATDHHAAAEPEQSGCGRRAGESDTRERHDQSGLGGGQFDPHHRRGVAQPGRGPREGPDRRLGSDGTDRGDGPGDRRDRPHPRRMSGCSSRVSRPRPRPRGTAHRRPPRARTGCRRSRPISIAPAVWTGRTTADAWPRSTTPGRPWPQTERLTDNGAGHAAPIASSRATGAGTRARPKWSRRVVPS